jgi:hypothetical protein
MMTTISAEVVLDSISESENRLTTLRLRYPRWIHAEGRTHRQLSLTESEYGDRREYDAWEPRTPSLMEDKNLSRNAASSRAIPVKRMIEAILDDPAVPIFWGKNQRGMQADEEIDAQIYLDDMEKVPGTREEAWLGAMENAIWWAQRFDDAGYHKQIVNRLLEPFMHIEVLVTATEWGNFFALRIHPAAEPHIRMLAERMKAAMSASVPARLPVGYWHLPYVRSQERGMDLEDQQILSAARCAHLSYETVGSGEPIGIDQARRIYSQLMGGDVLHASPLEHQATPDTMGYSYMIGERESWTWTNPHEHGNLVGWRQYRKMVGG